MPPRPVEPDPRLGRRRGDPARIGGGLRGRQAESARAGSKVTAFFR